MLRLCKKQKLWSFLRENRHLILDEDIRRKLHDLNLDCGLGRPPVAPERLALAMLLQAAFGVPDHEVPTLTVVDQRWQVILDGLGESEPLFSQGTVFNFRERVRESGIMRLLLEKTVELARKTKGFGHTRLRALFDSSPLVGAGRVEDTFNLLGRAIRKLVEVAAEEAGVGVGEVAEELDLSVVCASSVKAALDIDWRLPDAKKEALQILLDQFEALQKWMRTTFPLEELERPPLSEHLDTVKRLIEQDTEPDPEPPAGSSRPGRVIKKGGKNRQISLSDPDMRHGRKTKMRVFAGYKRHVATDADVPGLILAVAALAANQTESDGASPLFQWLDDGGFSLEELHIDRGYIANDELNSRRKEGLIVISKPPTPTVGKTFGKYDFALNFTAGTATCPSGIMVPFRIAANEDGPTISWPTSACSSCALRKDCLGEESKRTRRQIKLHPNEEWFREMSAELATPEGRARRRERVAVEHTLARVSAIQGNQARFRGLPKTQFDLERAAVINNLHVLSALKPSTEAA